MIEMFRQAGIGDVLHPEVFVDMREQTPNHEQLLMDEVAIACYDAMTNAVKHTLPSGADVWATKPINYESREGVEVPIWLCAERRRGDRLCRTKGQTGDRTVSMIAGEYWDMPLAYVVPATELCGATVLVGGDNLPTPEQSETLSLMALSIRDQHSYHAARAFQAPEFSPVRTITINKSDIRTVEDTLRVSNSMARLERLMYRIGPALHTQRGIGPAGGSVRKELEHLSRVMAGSGSYGLADYYEIVDRFQLVNVLPKDDLLRYRRHKLRPLA